MKSLYSKFITESEREYIKYNIDIRKILNHYGKGNIDAEWFLCPNPDHNDRHPSAHYVNNDKCKNSIVCFACPNITKECIVYDTIQTWALLNGLDKRVDYVRICKELLEFDENFNATIDVNFIRPEEVKEKSDEEYKKDIEYRISISKDIHQLHNERKFFLDKYLNERAIDYKKIKPFLEKFNIEFRLNYFKNINTCYININNELILCRQIEDYLQGNENKPHQKYNIGRSTFNYFDNGKKQLLVFEGFYDMLSFISNLNKEDIFLYNYLCLNSVNNVNKFINYDYENNILGNLEYVVLMLDSDIKGQKASWRLIQELEELSVDYENEILEDGLKDVNEYFIKEKKKNEK